MADMDLSRGESTTAPQLLAGSPSSPEAAAAAQADWPSPGYAWYTVLVLLLAAMISLIDRQILALLVEPIKKDLGLTDVGISLLQGLAFALFHAIALVPFGYLADRYSRKTLIGIGMLVWTLATAMCGLAQSFWHLFLGRMAVGIGESALGPSAHSLIGDSFPRDKVPVAMGVFSAGIGIGVGLAFIVGGGAVAWAASAPPISIPLIGELKPWQLAFIAVGLPGVPVALLILALREPSRKGLSHAGAGREESMTETLAALWTWLRDNARLAFWYMVGVSLLTTISYGWLGWMPAYFGRTFGWNPGQIGLVVGLLVLIPGTIGGVCGGLFAGWLTRRGHRDATLRTAVLIALFWPPIAASALVLPTPGLVVALLVPATLLSTAWVALGPSTIQIVVPNELRAKVSALGLLTTSLVGMTIGPTSVALLTEYVFADAAKVGHSLAIMTVTLGPLAALALSRCLAPLRAKTPS